MGHRRRLLRTKLLGTTVTGVVVRLLVVAAGFVVAAVSTKSTQLDAHSNAKLFAWFASSAAFVTLFVALPNTVLPTTHEQVRRLTERIASRDPDAGRQEIADDVVYEVKQTQAAYTRLRVVVVLCAFVQVVWGVWRLLL